MGPTAYDFETGVLIVSALIVMLLLIPVLMLAATEYDLHGRSFPMIAVRFSITLVLGLCLLARQKWARWLTISLLAFSAYLYLSVQVQNICYGEDALPLPILVGLLDLAAAIVLMASKSVRAFYSAPSIPAAEKKR